MSDETLRDRIARAVQCSGTVVYPNEWYPIADAVLAELCLHREEMSEWAVLANGFRGHRFVTHWEENDE